MNVGIYPRVRRLAAAIRHRGKLMARIRWDGKVFAAEPVRQLDNGNWIMRAQSHGARFAVGTEIEVTPGEIVEMTSFELFEKTTLKDFARAQNMIPQKLGLDGDQVMRPGPLPDHSLAQLEVAMAAERETLPSPQSIIATSPAVAHDAPDKVVSVPTDFT